MSDVEEFDKYVVMLVRCSPLGTQMGTEALRMAVGQTTANRVTVILVDAAVWLVGRLNAELPGGAEIAKWLGLLAGTGHQVWAERESIDRYELDAQRVAQGVRLVGRDEVDRELLAADVVMVF